MLTPKVGLQLYTVRKLAERDFIGTFENIARMGYQAVAFAGYHGQQYKVLRQALEQNKLEPVSGLIAINWESPSHRLKELEKEFEYANQLGLQYVVVPLAPWPDKPKASDVDYVASVLQQTGEKAREAGLKLGFHSHETECRYIGNEMILDRLLRLVPKEVMMLVVDVGAMFLAGCKTEDVLRKHAGRVPFVHMKDYKNGRRDAPIGQGLVNFVPVLAAAQETGLSYVFVEQEQTGDDPLSEVRQSLVFFAAQGWVPMPPPEAAQGSQQQSEGSQLGGTQPGEPTASVQPVGGDGGQQQAGQMQPVGGDGGQQQAGQMQQTQQGNEANEKWKEQSAGSGSGSGAQNSGTGAGGSGTGTGQSS